MVIVSKMMKLFKRSSTIKLAVMAIGLMVLTLNLTLLTPHVNVRDNPGSVSAAAYKKQLQGQVDTSNGDPRTGRDPANQLQTSLASVASQPTSSGKSTDSSAATSSNSQNSSTSSSGLGANGCYVDYGIQGQECLAAHAATNGVLTCDGVRGHGGFPNGIKVTGTDRYHLDTNHDGIACGAGDNA